MLHGVNRIRPRYSWHDIDVPDETLAQLREFCRHVTQRRALARKWRHENERPQPTGITALFAGPSGTGKTMAAEVIAKELGLELYRIDLAAVVSKYIGETEKNLHRVFEQTQDTSAILLFDEADALFGKRSEVKDSRDRYANSDISYLLQRLDLVFLTFLTRCGVSESGGRQVLGKVG